MMISVLRTVRTDLLDFDKEVIYQVKLTGVCIRSAY